MKLKPSTHIKVRYLPKWKCKMGIECIQDAKLEDTGFNYTMFLIQGKYKMFILYALAWFGCVCFKCINTCNINIFSRRIIYKYFNNHYSNKCYIEIDFENGHFWG